MWPGPPRRASRAFGSAPSLQVAHGGLGRRIQPERCRWEQQGCQRGRRAAGGQGVQGKMLLEVGDEALGGHELAGTVVLG